MNKALESKTGKVVFNDYIGALNNYYIPYFGNKNIDNIDHAACAAFSEWRREKLKCNPARSTITTHISALNRVFDVALEKGYLNKSQIPDLLNDGVAAEQRPDFTEDEYEKLCAYMDVWVTQGKQGRITDKREILRDYVYFVAGTGCRPGTETQGIKWSHIRYGDIDGVPYLHVSVIGKTKKPREIIANHSVIRSLTRLLHRQTAYKDMPVGGAIEKKLDAYVFALPNGEEVKNLLKPFEILLDKAGLLIDSRVSASGIPQHRTLYGLRHYYITRSLNRGTPVPKVAVQCGTSIAMIDKYYYHGRPSAGARELVLGKQTDND